MSSNLLGALLIVAGIVFLAVQVTRHGPLSSAKRGPRGVPQSLEPRQQGPVIDVKANWLGYVLIALGALVLLTGVPV
jgi:drug/metabolite transporter (DMT)-like permease